MQSVGGGEKTNLRVVLLLSSSGAERSSFEVALDMEEVAPCNQNHGGTFLEHKRPTEDKWSCKRGWNVYKKLDGIP